MSGSDIDSLFFFDNGKRFPFLRKSQYIPTEKLPEALQEFRLTSGETSRRSEATLHALKVKEKNKQNVNFNEHGKVKKAFKPKRRKRFRGDADSFFEFDIEDDGKFLFEEAKYSSTTILEQLGKILQDVWERIVYQNNWNTPDDQKTLKFEKDIKGFKWRFEINDRVNKKNFILPEHIVKLINVEYSDFCRVIQYKPREWQTQAYKDVTNFTTGALKRTDSGIFSVPPTRMSELTTDGDKQDSKSLEVKSSYDSGLAHPAILQYRRESKTPVYFVPKPHVKHAGKLCIEKGPPRRLHDTTPKTNYNNRDKVDEDEEIASHTTKFSLSSKDCHKKGWVTLPGSFSEHEKKAIIRYLQSVLSKKVAARKEEELNYSKFFIYPEVSVYYYGDAKKKAALLYQRSNKGISKKRKSVINKNGIPFLVTLRDGSFSIYYPSGNVCAVNSFTPGNPSSSYVLVYADVNDNNAILGHFKPSGCGVCYHKNGRISFISTAKHACCHDENGALIDKWKWTGRKLTPCYTLKLSANLTFRCSNKDSMTLFVNIDGESTKIKLADGTKTQQTESQVCEEVKSQQEGELHQDQIKPKKRRWKWKEEQKIVEETISEFSLKSSQEVECYESELSVLHEKFKNTVHSWINHYHIATGLKAPGELKLIYKSAGLPTNSRSPTRNSSAPSKTRDKSPSREVSSDSLFNDDSAICLRKLPFRCGVLQSPGAGLPKKGCPVVYRMQLMGIKDAHCRCDRKKIPTITDIEFDAFLESLPKTQLIVVSVFQERSSNPFDCTLHDIHYQLNKERSFPCVQSSCDPFRLFRYPIPSSTKNGETALLVKRHKVAAGMFIMYLAGKLLFSDYIFDGYGYTKKDFLNQVTRTRKEALDEKYLPDDYHFTARSRSPSPHKIREYGSCESVDVYNNKASFTSNEEHDPIRRGSCSPDEYKGVRSSSHSVTFLDNKGNINEIKSIS